VLSSIAEVLGKRGLDSLTSGLFSFICCHE
jgi:hypothetical protein